jgi:hypothetical protein
LVRRTCSKMLRSGSAEAVLIHLVTNQSDARGAADGVFKASAHGDRSGRVRA